MSMELSRWRLEKVHSTFLEGEKLLEIAFYSGAINRFYYAAFHAARALLATRQMDSSKHSGVISLFNREFVKPGLISKESGKTLNAAFNIRSEADYDDFTEFTLSECESMRESVKLLIIEVEKYIEKQKTV